MRNVMRIAVVLLIVALFAVWRWSPLIAVPCMIVACILMVPLSWMIVASGLLFGFGWGFVYAHIAGVVSGMLGFYLGRFVGHAVVQRLAGGRIHRFSAAVGKQGILAAVALRVIPFAPFTVQNMIAGASHMTQRDFGIGNALGLVPGTLFILLVMNQLNSSLESPDGSTITGLVLIIAGMAALLYGLRRRLKKQLGGGS